MNQVKSVNCPACQKQVDWTEANEHRPFCSARCKMIDFGEWATEKQRIPGDPVFPPEDDEPLQ